MRNLTVQERKQTIKDVDNIKKQLKDCLTERRELKYKSLLKGNNNNQDRINYLTQQINELRLQKKKLNHIAYYEAKVVTKNTKRKIEGVCHTRYGKRYNELTTDEKREYNREAQRRSRECKQGRKS